MVDWLADDALEPPDVARCAPFRHAADQGRLVLPGCRACDTALELDQVACHGCAQTDDVVWRDVPLLGHVHAASWIHRVSPAQILTDRPYPLLDIEFAAGHRLVLTTTSATTTVPPVGAAVRIAFRRVGNTALPAVDLDG